MKFRETAGRVLLVAILGALAVLILVRFQSRTGGPADIDWQASVPEQPGRATLVYFTASWCGPCQSMARESWPDDRVEAAMKERVAVKIDVDADPITSQKFNVEAMPTMVLLDGEGNEIRRTVGYLSAEDLHAFITG